MSVQPLAPAASNPAGPNSGVMEVWQIQVPGTIRLNVLTSNRFGHLVEDYLMLGPNAVGRTFKISADDRRDNQEKVYDPINDPFINGMLLRFDADQQRDPGTATIQVMGADQILEVLDLPMEAFKLRIAELGEVPVRKILDLAPGAGAAYEKVTFLKEYVAERWRSGSPQPEEWTDDDGKAEKLS